MGGFKAQRNSGTNGRIPHGVLAGATTGVSLVQKAGKPIQRQMDGMPLKGRQGEMRPFGSQVPELSLDLLASEANQRYAEHLRLAYEALVEVERERGLYYGDTLSDL